MEPIKIVLSGTLACDLMKSLTPEEREGIEEERTLEGVRLTLPPRFHWVTVPYTGYLKRLHLATVPNGDPRIQLVYNKENELLEVNVLPKRPQS